MLNKSQVDWENAPMSPKSAIYAHTAYEYILALI